MVCWEVIPFLSSSVHECGLAHSSFSSRKMKYGISVLVSQTSFHQELTLGNVVSVVVLSVNLVRGGGDLVCYTAVFSVVTQPSSPLTVA